MWNRHWFTINGVGVSDYYHKAFVPDKGYKGICPVCKQDFYGKADKKYHPACKIALGNQKAAQKRKMIQPLVRRLQKQDQILRDFYVECLREGGVDHEVLEKAGFDFTVTSRKARLENGWDFYIINRFAYSFDQYKGKVAIETTTGLIHIEKIKL